MADHNRYTCKDYRQEMILLSLHRQLNQKDLPETEKEKILKEIKKLERMMFLAE